MPSMTAPSAPSAEAGFSALDAGADSDQERGDETRGHLVQRHKKVSISQAFSTTSIQLCDSRLAPAVCRLQVIQSCQESVQPWELMAGQLPVWPAGAESPQGGNQEAGQKAQGVQWVLQGLDERGGLACAFC